MKKPVAVFVVAALGAALLAPTVMATETTNAERNQEWLLDKFGGLDGQLEEVEDQTVTVQTLDGEAEVTFGEFVQKFGARSDRANIPLLLSGAGDGDGAQAGDIWLIEAAVNITEDPGHGAPPGDCPSPMRVAPQPFFHAIHGQFWLYSGWVHTVAQSNVATADADLTVGTHIGWTTKDSGFHTDRYSYTTGVSDLFCVQGDIHFDLDGDGDVEHILFTVNFPFADGVSVQTTEALPTV